MCEKAKPSKKKGFQGGKYSSELYAACKYILEYLEEFKEFKIYDDLNSEFSSWGSDTAGRAKDLHNRLKAQYDLLIGKKESKKAPKNSKNEEASVKGSDLMPSLDTASIKTGDLARILAVFHHYINKDETRNKLKKSLVKIDIEKSTELLDYLISEINKQCTDGSKRNQNVSIETLNNEYEFTRSNFISRPEFKNSDGVDCYHQRMIRLHAYAEELKLTDVNGTKFDPFRNIYNAWMYIDLCCYTILQFVIHGIMRNQKNKYKLRSIKEINLKILELIERAENNKSEIKIEGTPEEMMFRLCFYYYKKDRFLQDIEMLRKIEESGKERKNPLQEYSLIRYSPKDEKIDWEDLQEVFSEGEEKEGIKTFKKNLMNCYKGIFRFDDVARRDIPPDPISLRAFYRELYRDKTTYSRRQSKTIFNDFLANGDMRHADYFFIDEKINVGMYREYSLMEEYHEKNILQENLYCLACHSLAKLNPFDMVETFRKAMISILIPIERINIDNEVNVYDKKQEILYKKTAGKHSRCSVEELVALKSRLDLEYLRQKQEIDNIDYTDIEKTMLLNFNLYNKAFPDGII